MVWPLNALEKKWVKADVLFVSNIPSSDRSLFGLSTALSTAEVCSSHSLVPSVHRKALSVPP